MNEDQLEHMFLPYGTIVQKKLLMDKMTGLSRGIAFIR